MLWSSKSAQPSLRKATRRQRAKAARHQHGLQALEQRTLLTAASGYTEIFPNGVISGWVSDPDSPTAAVTVRVTVDGISRNITASTVRVDGKLQFSDTVGPGTHTVSLAALDVQTGGATVFKTGTITNAAPVGGVVMVNGGTGVTGYVTDANATGQVVQMQVYQNGELFSTVTANATIGALPAGHAFNVTGLTAGSVVDVFAIDAPSGKKWLMLSNDRASRGGIENFTATNVKGWVWDPDLGTDPVSVSVVVDGVIVATQTANANDTTTPNLATLTGTANRGFNFDISSFVGPGTHAVQVVATETGTAARAYTVLQGKYVSNAAPVGNFFLVNNTVVAGWAADVESGNNPITITVKVDGVTNATTTTNIPISQAVKPMGATYTAKGYAVGLTGVSGTAPHFVQVFATDSFSGKVTLNNQQLIQNHAATGQFLVARPDVISGWAFDADTPNTPTTVKVYVDGRLEATATAGYVHAGLNATFHLGSDAHGFDIPTPTELAGTHTVSVYAVDSFDGALHLIGTRSFTNHAPYGVVQILRTGISGYAIDPDAPNATIQVVIRVDGVTSSVALSADRPVAGIGNHGFVGAFNPGFAGTTPHTISVYFADAASGVTTLISTKVV